MKPAGILLLAIGFLTAAYLASLDPVATPWAWFLPAIGVAFAGLVLHRRAAGKASKAADRVATNRQVLAGRLDRIVAELEALAADKEAIPPHEFRFEVDRRFRDDLAAFADARDTMAHLFGIQAYADIMGAFAAGERYLNRVWSASTDGYVDEVLSYVERARTQFLDAKRLLDAALARVEA